MSLWLSRESGLDTYISDRIDNLWDSIVCLLILHQFSLSLILIDSPHFQEIPGYLSADVANRADRSHSVLTALRRYLTAIELLDKFSALSLQFFLITGRRIEA